MNEDKLVKQMQAKTAKHNILAQMAMAAKRNYITPEDIEEALETHPEDKIRLDALEIMADNAGFGCEDRGLCAWVAFKGKNKKQK